MLSKNILLLSNQKLTFLVIYFRKLCYTNANESILDGFFSRVVIKRIHYLKIVLPSNAKKIYIVVYLTFEILYSIVFFTKGFVQSIGYLVTVTSTSVGVPMKYIGVNIGASFDIKKWYKQTFLL